MISVVTPTNVEINLALIESIQLEPSVIHMNVKMGSKVSNLINYANKKLKVRTVILNSNIMTNIVTRSLSFFH